jgi:hypothetical protein
VSPDSTPQKLQTALDVLFSPAGHRGGKPTITRLAKIAGVVPKTVYTYPAIVSEFKRRKDLSTGPTLMDWESECRRRSTEFKREIRAKNESIRERERERDAAYQRIQILELRLIDAEKLRLVALKDLNEALKVSSIS